MPALPTRTFSESWYRVSGESVSLRPCVTIHRQFFRGEKWYVLRDPFNNQFFRLRPAAYEFVVRLRKGRTVEDVWQECLELFEKDAPGQEEAIQLLAQLYHANLLEYPRHGDSVSLFKRFSRQRQAEIKSRLAGFMFPRITLLDPDAFLKRTMPIVRPFMGPLGVILWILVVTLGVKSVVDNLGMAIDQSQSVLAPANLVWLYVALVISKVLHEFGHAYVCRKSGGEVHRMGVMFLIFTPLPFVDATSSWTLRSRRQRIMVSAAGMWVEIFIASIAAMIWAYTGGGLLHRLCYNIVFAVSVSTLLFNANPLLRFDGYYILSDLLDIPNLHERSRRQFLHVARRVLFGQKHSRSLARSRWEAVQLYIFAVLSGIYRIVVFTSILLFVADQLFVIGLIFAFLCFVAWGVVPVVRFLRYLFASPELTRERVRAVTMTAVLPLALLVALGAVPLPQSFRAPGVLESDACTRVYTETEGTVVAVHTRPGQVMVEGEPILELTNTVLSLELRASQARLDEIQALQRKALQQSTADLEPIDALMTATRQQVAQLQRRREGLTLLAAHDGVWDGPDLGQSQGCWVGRGAELGRLVSMQGYEFIAIVSQSDAARLFSGQMTNVTLKLKGQSHATLTTHALEILPVEQEWLPSQALGWSAGGAVETDYSDPSGTRAREPFFQVTARIDRHPAVVFAHGLAGTVRFELPDEPLLPRWMRRVRQLLQKRYRL